MSAEAERIALAKSILGHAEGQAAHDALLALQGATIDEILMLREGETSGLVQG